jgi:hypothetical protein
MAMSRRIRQTKIRLAPALTRRKVVSITPWQAKRKIAIKVKSFFESGRGNVFEERVVYEEARENQGQRKDKDGGQRM